MKDRGDERRRQNTLAARMSAYLECISQRGSDAGFNEVTGQDLRDLRQAAIADGLVAVETVGLTLTEKGRWLLATTVQEKRS
jgi:hypothetical protein